MNQQTSTNIIEDIKEKYKDIYNVFKEKNCELIFFVKKTIKLKYICACGIEKERLYKDFARGKECRTCKDKKLKEKPIDINEENITVDGEEIWKTVFGGWVSSFGNAKNSLGKILTLCPTKFRYRINGKHQYASRIIAEAFQIENYEKLIDPKYVVSHIDNDSSNNNINNLIIITKSEISSRNGKKSRQSDTFKEKINWTKDHFKEDNIQTKIIPEFPKHIIYYNGEIWNGSNFLTFSKTENYLNMLNIKVHRLICYAFHPIEGKEKLSDYDKIQVNHKDGNTLNNHADNLEWVSNSENMFHSYSTNLNKKVRNVLQYTKENVFIKEFISISQASRESGEPEHRIRSISQGKSNAKAEFIWKFKNDEQTKEYSEKYSVK